MRHRIEKPDVTLLSLNYPPEPTGIAPYTGALAAGLHEVGYTIQSRVAHPHYPEWTIRKGYGQWRSSEDLDGVRVQRLRHYVPGKPRGLRRLVSEISFGVRLAFTRFGHLQAVVAVSPPLFATAITVLRLRLTPRRPSLIVWVQDIYTLGMAETGEGGEIAQRITRWVESRMLRAADRVVVIHQRFQDFVIEELAVPAENVAVVRNWTHLPAAEPEDGGIAKAALGWPEGVTLAVHTGNMGSKQGLENLVDAARMADERELPVHFILLGDGGERRELEKRARGVSRITFLDPVGDAEYWTAINAADVLVVNEKPGVAGMAVPSKLTSYFAAARPVIAATDDGGITAAEVRAADAGVVVRAGDPAALLDAVLTIRSDPAAAARYGRNGQRYRDRFLGQTAAIDRWVAVIEELRSTGAGRVVTR